MANAAPELLASLATDLALEHAAVYQYIVQGRQLRDSALANDVMELAREEMWHLDWLADAIKERLGVPTVDRGDVFLSAGILEGLRADIHSEEVALAHYACTLELIGDDDPELRLLIERIVDDERHHHAAFARLAERVVRDGESEHLARPCIAPGDIAHVAPAVALEYEGLLQHLWSKYGCDDCEQADTYFELAIEEMRHAAWAAGFMAGLGAPVQPELLTDRVMPVSSRAEALARSEAFERKAAETYEALSSGVGNLELRDALQRAARQHAYHRDLLDRMRPE